MKALITGITGFAGNYLTDVLLDKGYEVYGTVKSRSGEATLKNTNISYLEGDLLDRDFTDEVIKKAKPDLVFHLASFTSPAKSLEDPSETVINNIGITLNLLESLKSSEAKVLLIGSSDEYGLVKEDENPVNENNPLRPTNPYAVSKITQDFLGFQYSLAFGMHIVRVRPGNHVGPGQRDDFVVSSFAKQIALIELGKQDPVIKVGNIESERDITDVRDIVRAYLLALLQGKAGEVYNLGSNRSVKIKDVLSILIGLSSSKLKIEEDNSRKRLFDIPKISIDYSKFHQLTNWKPEIKLEKSLEDTLNYWRKNV